MSDSLDYYNNNSQDFFESTVEADVSNLRQRFTSLLKAGSYILDFGCGSGRDTKAFRDDGYIVDAIDGSEEMCKLASQYTGISVKCSSFDQLNESEKYDGVWACASLLHVEYDLIPGILVLIRKALKPDGVLYMSFKLGDSDESRNGRRFTDMNEERFNELRIAECGYAVVDKWQTVDVREDKNNNWFNVLLRKV